MAYMLNYTLKSFQRRQGYIYTSRRQNVFATPTESILERILDYDLLTVTRVISPPPSSGPSNFSSQFPCCILVAQNIK